MKQAILKITFFTWVLFSFVGTAWAEMPADSLLDRQATIIRESLISRITENERLIREGRASEANYIVYDETNPPVSFFKYFTSENARKLWIKRGFMAELIMQENISQEVTMMNEWIASLRKTYIDNSPYKDYKIYFVVSGIYNYDNVDAKDPKIDWNEKRTISFNEEIKDKSSSSFTGEENKIITSILNKVANAPSNKSLVSIINGEKYIICFLFNLYKYFPGYHTQFVQGEELSSTGMRVISINVPNTFVVSGYFFNPVIGGDFIKKLSNYHAAHMDPLIGDAPKDLAGRNTFLAQQIRNVYTFFSTVSSNTMDVVDCSKSEQLRDRLELLYKNPLPNSPDNIVSSLTDLTVQTRKCLLQQLSGSSFCGDGNNWFLRLNACENLILDILKSTPPEQRRQLLDYLNESNDVLRGLALKMHDEGAGSENYTELIYILSQYAYDVYKTDLAMLKTDANFCGWLSYNPEVEYGPYSYEVLGKYIQGGDLFFEFRNYDGLCCEQVLKADGTIGYKTKSFHARPFDFVGIIPEVDLAFKFAKDNKEKSVIGEKLFVPAIMLHWNIKKTNTANVKKDGMMALQVATFFWGGSTAMIAGTALGKTLMAAEGVTTLANLVANSKSVKEIIIKKEGGQDFLATIDKINMLAGVSNVSYLTLAQLSRSIKLWKTYQSDRLLVSAPDFEAINTQMARLEEAMATDRLILRELPYNYGRTVGILDDAIRSAAPYLDELGDLGVNVRAITETELEVLTNVKKLNKVKDEVNVCKADVSIKNGQSYTSHATSGYPSPKSQNILTNPPGAPHPTRGNSVFQKYTFKADGTLRINDSEVKILEEFALKHGVKPGLADPVITSVEGNIKLYTELIPCASCTKVIAAFRKIFPNVEVEIITTARRTFK